MRKFDTGGKKNMKKRFLSIVLAVLMLVGIMPISAIAADAEPPAAQTGVSTKTSENTTGPKLEKSAQWVDEKAGIAKITIQVTGEQPTETAKKTDIVLVIDRSLSMTQNDRDWLKNAKKAAKAFAKKVLTGDPNVRIAVVAYAAKTINDWNFSSKLETVENNIDAINTNNVYYKGQWYADHDSWQSENWHGTNIQAGIHSARERFKSTGNNDANKFMIVLADGAPNYRFTYKNWGIGTKFDLTDAQKRTYHINNWFSWLFYATSDAFNYNNEVKNTEQYAYTAAASEAYAAKATDGITCYAIGYGIPQGNNEINALMYSIASTDAGFVNAGTDVNAITKVFSDIATDIQYKAHDVKLTDTMGAGFTYLSNETYPSNPVVTPSADNKTVTWNVADKLGDETKTLTFYVQYDKNTLTDAATLPTNTSASLSYEDNKGNEQPDITVASPEIENLAKKVTYVDENNTAYTDPAHQEKPHWYGDTVTLAPAPTKEGYTFNGWTTDDVTIGENDTFEMPKQNVTLKATWTKNTKTLTITKNWEGTTEKPTVTFQLLQARKGEENTTVYQTFELDGIVDTEGEVVETAPWTATIKVPVKDTDGTEFKYSVKETKIGGTSIGAGAFNVTGTNPDNTSYIIGTWSVNSSGRPLDGTWTFTNKYAPKPQYTLTYEFVGEDKPEGANAPAAESLYKDQQTHLAEVNAPDGWSFDGWYTDAGCTEGNKVTSPYTMPGSNMTLYGKWEQKQPGVTVEKTAKRTRGNESPVTLPNNTNDPNEIGRVQVGDVINYTVTIKNTGKVTFGNNINDYRFTDTFSNATGDLIQIDEDGKQIGKVESGKRPPNISLGDMKPGDTKTLYYRYMVRSGDVGQQINNSATAEIKSGTGAGKITRSSNVRVLVEAPEPETATLRFEFKSGTDGKDLPASDMPPVPNDVTEEVGTAVQLTNYTETVNDEGNKGKWTFGGWFENESLTQAVAGDSYQIPEGGKTLYGKWTFEADKPEITEAGYTVEYYRQNADGENYTLQEDTDSGVAEVGKEKTIEPAEDKYSGYTYNETESIVTLTIQEEEDKNVFKVYYDAVRGLAVTKTITDVTRDGEPLNPDNPEVEVKEGDVIEYEITVRNSGKLNLTDIVLTDEFTGAEGDLTFISGDDYTVDGYEITLKNDLNVGDSVTIKATYEVQLGDSGYEITNKASGTAKDALKREVTGESRPVGITPDALKAYRIFGSVYKYVKSEKGTFNKDEETVPFEFKVTSDKKGEEILDTFTIDVEETVKAGETSEGDWGGFDFNLSEEEFENLDKKEFNGKEYPVVYLWELKGDLKNMSYSTKRITLYLDRPNISYYSAREPMVEYLGTRMAYADPDKGADADIINIYGKQSSSGSTVKVGPQLNRDDHVAYIMGYPDGTVQPEGEITRAEACTIFFRLLTDSSRDYYFSKTNDYTDVNAGDWFNNAISTLSNAGIVTGYNDGTFRPNQPITRGEMAKIIANFANLNKGTKSFTDLSGHWSKTYVELAAGNGWIAGYPDGSFRPDQKITRAETVTMINRVLERVPAKELRLLSRSIMLTFPDNNPGDWYYIAIQEASNSHEYQRSVYETTGDEMWTKLIDNVDWTKLEK